MFSVPCAAPSPAKRCPWSKLLWHKGWRVIKTPIERSSCLTASKRRAENWNWSAAKAMFGHSILSLFINRMSEVRFDHQPSERIIDAVRWLGFLWQIISVFVNVGYTNNTQTQKKNLRSDHEIIAHRHYRTRLMLLLCQFCHAAEGAQWWAGIAQGHMDILRSDPDVTSDIEKRQPFISVTRHYQNSNIQRPKPNNQHE